MKRKPLTVISANSLNGDRQIPIAKRLSKNDPRSTEESRREVDVPSDDKEEPDDWYLSSELFQAPKRKPMPANKDLCVCGRKQCTRLGATRYQNLQRAIPLTRVSRHENRLHISNFLNIPQSKMQSVRFHIKMHHYPIEHRHHAQQRGDKQFERGGCYIIPSMTDQDIEEEIDLATNIRKHNECYYTKHIEPHLLGYGDGSLTLEKLRSCNNKVNEQSRSTVDTGERLDLNSLDNEEVIKMAKEKGSAFIRTLIKSMPDDTKLAIPGDIPLEAFLHYYLDMKEPLEHTTHDVEYVAACVPHSVASRRDYSRPAKEGSPKDITLVVPLDIDSLMDVIIPMNEPPKGNNKKTKGYVGNELKEVGIVRKTFISQNKTIRDYEIMECFDKKKNQTIYVDINGDLPSLTTRKSKKGKLLRTSWNHAHYYLIRDILTRDEVSSAIDFSRVYNQSYLPVILLFMCRTKGKLYEERTKEDKLTAELDKYSDCKQLQSRLNEFQQFFERYLTSIIRNITMISIEDLERLTWSAWNNWNDRLEQVYNEEDKKSRLDTRSLAKKFFDKTTIEKNSLIHYVTILLHTQGM
jgi:hypothetical protein